MEVEVEKEQELESDHTITSVSVTAAQVEKVLLDVDAGKATGPDNISPRVLKNFAKELSEPLANIFSACLVEKKRPAAWKEANVFGFRAAAPPLISLLLLSQEWQDSLEGLDTLVVALDIAGAFDRVWHSGLLAKLCAKGIEGSLLTLLEDYLHGRSLRVVVNGRTSTPV
ncbi:uncharacterized protein LOC126981400 [Eriocheir sinensis]|uniref:uncharacterized protein LOC126981400 n=1 Tax=Eriocheir sinensis TaxID=95602 RepID=UPI0021C60257|nr:uncharacterized protein LOC126981400 [Eriocheir sinensis]